MISEAQLPGFVPASEILPGNLSREGELEELVRKLSADAERRSNMVDSGPAGQATGKLPAVPKPQEWQSLQIVISDLLEAKKDLQSTVKKLTLQIEDLQKANGDLQQDIIDIRALFTEMMAEDRRRIKALELGPDNTDNATAKAHVDELYNHMKAIGRKQISFKDASRCLKLSKSRILQLKAIIILDDRFVVVPSESHKQKELIRLREYFQRDGYG